MRFTLVTLTPPLAALACAPMPRPASTAPAPVSASVAASDSSCVAALDSMEAIFRRDYPGYLDKVPGREAELAALTDSVRAIARTSDHYDVCIPALKRWARFFRDPHVEVWQAAPPKPPEGGAARAVTVPPAPAADDPDRPSLRFVDDSAAVLRLPDFDIAYKPLIDSVVTANWARLLATPYLVVDVRGNGGGSGSSYQSVAPLLYTGPVSISGTDVWASEGNITALRPRLTDERIPQGVRARLRATIARMEANLNRFVVWQEDTVIRRDTVYAMPRRVAVLVDGQCASSCEGFVIEATQSRKVTVFGAENTKGVLDYGNTVGRWLPGWRRMVMPTTRGHLTPKQPLDFVGLAPQVRIPAAEPDHVQFAVRRLRSG